jgi:type VI secretion system protein ImpE
MTAQEFFEAGDLASAITQASEDLKKDPGNPKQRIFLFEMLCCTGELDRAAKHLDVLAPGNANVQSYRNVVGAEKKRRLVFAEGRTPGLPKHAPPYTQLHLDALSRIREGKGEEALALLEQAEQMRPAVAGVINNQEQFDDLKDADDLMGPFLEVITATNYSWVPWEIVRTVIIPAPENLRDMIWLPARVELEMGSLGEVFIPVLYAGSYLQPDVRVKLGQVTEWRSDVEGLALAYGQRLLMAGGRDYPILEIRSLEIERTEVPNGHTSHSN